MQNTITTLEAEIKDLIDLQVGAERAPYLDRVERTLTDGYAHALQLEAERWRLQRRLGEIAASIGTPDENGGSTELPQLARSLSAADGELSRLRGILSMLRRRADAVRASA